MVWRKGAANKLYMKPDEVCDQLKVTERERLIVNWFTDKLRREVESKGGVLETWCELPLRKDDVVGTCDLVVLCVNGEWLVVDWKTGGLEVKTAAENIQLCGYLVMGRDRFGYNKASGYLFSAGNERGEQFTKVTYNGVQMEQAWEHVSSVIRASSDPQAECKPSLDACRYCPALGNAERCPKSVEHGLALVEQEKGKLLEIKNTSIATTLTPAQKQALVQVWDGVSYAKRLHKMLANELYRRLSAGEDVPGFMLSDPVERRNITDTEKAYQHLVHDEKLATHEEFMAELSMTGAGAQRACKRGMALRGIKSKDMRQYLDPIMKQNGYMETKAGNPRLHRIGEEDEKDE